MERFDPKDVNAEPIREPKFDISESRDSTSERDTILNLNYGNLSYTARVDLGNGKLLSEAYPSGQHHDEAADHVERMRVLATKQAQEYAFGKMMEDFQ